MSVEKQNGQIIIEAVRSAVEQHGATREELIPILIDVNRQLGYLPSEALEEISRLLRVSKSQLFSVASFYQMLSTKQQGRHVIQFCESAPCHIVGGQQVWQALLEELKLDAGETSPDGKWTLLTTSCLGVCAVGPVIIVDNDIFGNVTPEQIPGILARYF
jgi:NADH-quinone oxidoreductase subunit E